VWIVAAIASALALPSLALGLVTDDRVNAYRVRHGSGPFSLFELPTERFEYLLRVGAFSWWTNPELRVDFLRPLSALFVSRARSSRAIDGGSAGEARTRRRGSRRRSGGRSCSRRST
jgi:hypothetical protein